MEPKTATQALENIGNMAQEMEDRYEKQIELLNFQVEDACKMAERYLLENQELKKHLDVDKALESCVDAMSDVLEEENEELTTTLKTMSEKVKELETENNDLVQEAGELILEAREARRSFTALQISVSVLIFLYGIMYGRYSC